MTEGCYCTQCTHWGTTQLHCSDPVFTQGYGDACTSTGIHVLITYSDVLLFMFFLSLSIDPSGTTGSQKKRPAGAVPMFGGSDSKGLFGDDDDEASAEPAQAKSEPQRVRLCVLLAVVKRRYIVWMRACSTCKGFSTCTCGYVVWVHTQALKW